MRCRWIILTGLSRPGPLNCGLEFIQATVEDWGSRHGVKNVDAYR